MKTILAAAVVLAAITSPMSPVAAAPKPPPEPVGCHDSWPPYTVCYYQTKIDCSAARRAKVRAGVNVVSACYPAAGQEAADPDLAQYVGLYALRQIP
jgi:hypothetical protein